MSNGWRYNAVKGWPGKGAGALKWVTVLLKAKRKRLNADQHTRYTGNTHCHADTHVKIVPGLGSRMNGSQWSASEPHGQIEKSSSGARGATRQHTVNPKTVLMLHSMCVRNFHFILWLTKKDHAKWHMKYNYCACTVLTVTTVLYQTEINKIMF